MPTVNENKQKNDNSVSPMRDLFIKNENNNSDNKSKEDDLKENNKSEQFQNNKNSPNEHLKKLKFSLEKLVLALKHPIEENSYEDDEDNIKENAQKINAEKSEENKADEEDSEFVIKDIFADIDSADDTEKTKENKIESNVIYQVNESNPKDEAQKKEEKIVKTEVKTKSSVILSSKEKLTENFEKIQSESAEKEDDLEPKEITAEKLWKELPEYNLFNESKNDTKADISEKVKKEIQKPLKKNINSKEKKPLDYQFKIKKNVSEMPEKTLRTVQNAKESKDKDLREGDALPITYHCDNSQPFIVMAGKFTRTLRGEYEILRVYYKSSPEHKIDEKKSPPVNKENTKKQPVIKVIEPDKKANPKKADAPAIIKKVEQTEPENKDIKEIKKPESIKKKKKKKQNFKFSFRDFMGNAVDEPNDDDVEEIKPKKLLDDYNDEKYADDIKTDIKKNLNMMAMRTVILLIIDVVSIIVAVIAQFTPLFSETMRTGWLFYAIISFILFTIAIISERLTIVNGLMPLRHFKGNSDTAAAVTAFAVAVQSITALCTPNVFTNGTYHIYVPVAITALLCNSIGKLLIILRTLDNFKFLSKPYPKYAGKIYTDMKNAEKMVSEFPAKINIIGYIKRSKFMSNFLRLSYAQDPSEELASKIAPATTLVSLIFGIVYGIMTLDFAGGVTSFALTSCIGTPMMSLIVLNIPMKMLCKNLLNGNAMISGYSAVQQFCDTNAIMIDTTQLYPAGTITLSGMKVFKQGKINDAIQAGAAIMYAVNGTMSYVFENIVHCSKDKLPKVESVVYEDEKGLLAWVNKQRVLIGNRVFLESHNIKLPKKELEEKYLKTGNEITYISISGELIAMFILSYRTDREIANELRELEENGVSFIIRTIDPNITKEKIAKKFSLFHRCISVLPTGLGNICHEVTSSVDEQSRAYLVTKGKISSFARAVSGCIKMKSAITIAKILQCAGIGFGILIFTLISFVSGFEKLGSIEILIYIIFWAIATIIPSLIKNR